jgi:putative hemolysin
MHYPACVVKHAEKWRIMRRKLRLPTASASLAAACSSASAGTGIMRRKLRLPTASAALAAACSSPSAGTGIMRRKLRLPTASAALAAACSSASAGTGIMRAVRAPLAAPAEPLHSRTGVHARAPVPCSSAGGRLFFKSVLYFIFFGVLPGFDPVGFRPRHPDSLRHLSV